MRHCILAKFNSAVTEERKASLAAEIALLFGSLTRIEGIEEVEVIPGCIDRPNRYDLLIRISMEPETLPEYDASFEHAQWKRDYKDLLESKAIFDYEEE